MCGPEICITNWRVRSQRRLTRGSPSSARCLTWGGEKCGALSQASLSVLGTVTIGERRCITQAVGPQDFKDGAVLIKEGEPRDALFIIVEGQVSFTQRRHHRYEVGPARAALLERLSALALGTPAPRCSARQGSLCSAARGPECHCTPRAPGASRL